MVNGKSNGGVVATARGVFTHEGGVLESHETGVSLRVPPGAIPQGVQQEIYFKVCRANEAHLPPLDADRGRFFRFDFLFSDPFRFSQLCIDDHRKQRLIHFQFYICR